METVRRQLRDVSATQRHWAANAMTDYRYNMAQAARDLTQGNVVKARMHLKEAELDREFAGMRREVALHPGRFYLKR